MNLMFRRIVFLFCIFFISYSCNQIDKPTDNNTIELKLQLGVGSSYYYTSSNISESTQEINGEEQSSSATIETGIQYDISKDSAGNFIFNNTYKLFKVKVKEGKEIREVDAANANYSLYPEDKVFGAFHNAVLVTTLTPTGEVKQVDGVSALTEKMQQIASSNEQARNMVDGTLDKYGQADFFKKSMEQSFRVFPGKPVRPGDSWTTTSIIDQELKVPYITTYTLKKVRDSIAIISLTGDIDIKDQKINIRGYEATCTISGSQEGEIEVDIPTGMVISSSLVLKIKGKTLVIGKEVPFSMKNSIRIEGKRL